MDRIARQHHPALWHVIAVTLLAMIGSLFAPHAAYSQDSAAMNDYEFWRLNLRIQEDRENAEDEYEMREEYLHFYVESEYKEDGENHAFARVCGDEYDNEFALTERVVRCLQNVITTAVISFMTSFSEFFSSVIMATILLAITLFGARILMGTVQNPGTDAFMLLIKIAGVLVFTNVLGGFYIHIFGIMESMAGYTLAYITDPPSYSTTGDIINLNERSAFMESCSTRILEGEFIGQTVTIWSIIDCIISRLFTGGPTETGVLWALAVGVFWTSFIGIFIFFIMVNVFITILLLVLRCVYMFIACYAYLGLLVAISPMIIPLILFRNTMKYFEKWYRQFVSMIVQPMILFGLMAFFFAVLDSVFFLDKNYSLSAYLGQNWEEPDERVGVDEDTIATMLSDAKNEFGYEEDDWEYQAYENWLRENREISRVGIAEIHEEQLINYEIDVSETLRDAGDKVPFDGGIAGDVLGGIGDLTDAVVNWGLGKVSKWLFPWKVPKIRVTTNDGNNYSSENDLLFDLLKFFLVVSIFLPLMTSFVKDIPRLMQYLSSARRTPGAELPGERQAKGAAGAVKGAATGAARGAISGFARGGVAGAKAGAAEGAVQGAKQGYRRGTGTASAGKTFNSGKAHDENALKKQGGDADRSLMHGKHISATANAAAGVKGKVDFAREVGSNLASKKGGVGGGSSGGGGAGGAGPAG